MTSNSLRGHSTTWYWPEGWTQRSGWIINIISVLSKRFAAYSVQKCHNDGFLLNFTSPHTPLLPIKLPHLAWLFKCFFVAAVNYLYNSHFNVYLLVCRLCSEEINHTFVGGFKVAGYTSTAQGCNWMAHTQIIMDTFLSDLIFILQIYCKFHLPWTWKNKNLDPQCNKPPFFPHDTALYTTNPVSPMSVTCQQAREWMYGK